MYERLCSLRIRQMFDIIVDYPDSMPAVQDVASCLQHTSMHTELTDELKSVLLGV
jgi:anaphase-promoting complex subunit 2